MDCVPIRVERGPVGGWQYCPACGTQHTGDGNSPGTGRDLRKSSAFAGAVTAAPPPLPPAPPPPVYN